MCKTPTEKCKQCVRCKSELKEEKPFTTSSRYNTRMKELQEEQETIPLLNLGVI